MKAMEIPGALGEEELSQVRKDWFDPLVREQHIMDAAGAFDRDSFYLPHQLIWEDKFMARLPVFLKDFVHEMHCVDFRKMTPSTRWMLWFGVRITFGLSESDFPYPEKLKELDKLDLDKNKSPKKAVDLLGLSIPDPRASIPPVFIAGALFIVGILAGAAATRSGHPASHAGHVPPVPSASFSPGLPPGEFPPREWPETAPERNIPGTPNPSQPPLPRTAPGSPGHP